MKFIAADYRVFGCCRATGRPVLVRIAGVPGETPSALDPSM